jgi:hypothetical protein
MANPFFTAEKGRDANGSTKYFVLVSSCSLKNSPGFMMFAGGLLKFDTKADALTFCDMANTGQITFPNLIPNKKTKTQNDN